MRTYGITLWKQEDIKDVDAVVFAVAHDEFKEMDLAKVKKLYNNTRHAVYGSEAAATSEEAPAYKDVLIDVKGIFDRK